jgi:fructoselysine and glucoselysine-specific PTS system IIC component
VITALALFVAALVLGLVDLFFGRNLAIRPIVTGTVVGFILGDPVSGMAIGATLELAFIGLFTVGGAMPPEILTGGMLATALAITADAGAETALALAFPIAALGLLVKNLHFVFVAPALLHRADGFVERGSIRGVSAMHILSGFLWVFWLSLVVGVSYAVGSEAIGALVDAIPEPVTVGLQVATGILPALGFALLGRMLMGRRVMPFFFIGFLVVTYSGLPIVGLAAGAAMIAWVLVDADRRRTAAQQQPHLVMNGAADDDF